MKGQSQHNPRGAAASAAKYNHNGGVRVKQWRADTSERWFGDVSWRQGVREINAAFEALKRRRPGLYE